MTLSPVIEHSAVAVCALSGVLAARGKQLDLFGVLVLAVVTAFGGGTVRDLLVGDVPVAWLRSPLFLYTALATGLVAFFVCRFWQPPSVLLLIADAIGLALFTVVGARKGLNMGFSPSVAVLLGIITGVAGGIVRDTMLGQVPVVFRRNTYLYATAAACGAGAYAALLKVNVLAADHAELCGIITSLLLRLGALRWKLALPEFTSRDTEGT
jgi:uncharacterized membrane protein YeiH